MLNPTLNNPLWVIFRQIQQALYEKTITRIICASWRHWQCQVQHNNSIWVIFHRGLLTLYKMSVRRIICASQNIDNAKSNVKQLYMGYILQRSVDSIRENRQKDHFCIPKTLVTPWPTLNNKIRVIFHRGVRRTLTKSSVWVILRRGVQAL